MSSRIFELILTGYRNRTIGERFFGTASLSILLITVSEAARVSFTQKLLWAVTAQGAVAFLAVVLSTFERRRRLQQQLPVDSSSEGQQRDGALVDIADC